MTAFGKVRIGRWPRLAAVLLAAGFALGQATSAAGEVTHPTVSSCTPVSGIKPLIRGLVDRGVAPPAAGLQASSINVAWSALEPSGPGLVADNPIDQAIAAAGCTPLRIRVLAGIATPAWVLALAGSVNVTNPYSTTPGVAGDFWTSEYATLYDDLESELAAEYESVPNVVEFVVSRCALFYPEPFILGTSIASNDTSLLAAGYTEAADQQCQQEEIDTAAADWPTTRIGVSFNPYQTLARSTNAKGYVTGTDEAYTEQMMAYCRYTLGQRCVLENDSIRDPISAVGGTQPYYTEMYGAMTGASGPVDLSINSQVIPVTLGAPLAFQTATSNSLGTGNIGDFWGTLEWAREQHAAAVELPVDGDYPPPPGAGAPAWQTLAEVSQWFQDTPALTPIAVTATQGKSTSGDRLATLTLSELAAVDTATPYGDVGSVPFDTVSAVITWPTGVVQAALVGLGTTGTPAGSVTCATQPCTVTIYSGGYTFPEQVVTGPASVAVTLDGGVTPADGVPVTGPTPLTVLPAPLSLRTLTVTPAKSAPTAALSVKFADADPLGVAADHTIRIAWGDGSTSTLAARAAGRLFSATASHRYARAGKETVTITITDIGGATLGASRAITLR